MIKHVTVCAKNLVVKITNVSPMILFIKPQSYQIMQISPRNECDSVLFGNYVVFKGSSFNPAMLMTENMNEERLRHRLSN